MAGNRQGPKNIAKLNASRTQEERKKAASKAGKASGKARREYASIRECFNDKVDSEMMEKAFDKLWRMFINKGSLPAYDRIVAFLDNGTKDVSENRFVAMLPERTEIDDVDSTT